MVDVLVVDDLLDLRLESGFRGVSVVVDIADFVLDSADGLDRVLAWLHWLKGRDRRHLDLPRLERLADRL